MDREEIARKFETLRVWQRGDERAPHKPLLVLYAIGKLLQGEDRLLRYSEVDGKLGNLLREFGPKRKAYHTQLPFWRLQNDGVWEIPEAYLVSQTPSGMPERATWTCTKSPAVSPKRSHVSCKRILNWR